jgi:hypothetical protein
MGLMGLMGQMSFALNRPILPQLAPGDYRFIFCRTDPAMDESDSDPFPEPVPLPITWELDLHPFSPREVKDLVPEYLAECRQRDILLVRIIHGKGIGNLRRTVHAILSRLPEVISYSQAGEQLGGWGATMVQLRPMEPSSADEPDHAP